MRRRPALSRRAFAPLALILGAALFDPNTVFAQQITLISAASDGTQASGGDSFEPAISADGRFVAFGSAATNLVPGDTNGVGDVFVKDRVSGAIERVSVRTTGEQGTDGSGNPFISADGRFVVFASNAPLVAEDTNTCGQPVAACTDVYIHDRQTHVTTRVSVSSTGAQGLDASFIRGLSADGRFVLFASRSPNLVNNDTNNVDDLFLHDRQTATTTRVSVDLVGGQLTNATAAGVMSADGRVIVYSVQHAVDQPWELYLRDRESGEVSVLSLAFPPRNLPAPFDPLAYRPFTVGATHISDDGRVVVVVETSDRITTMRPLPPISRYLLHDRLTGHTIATEWRESVGPYNGDMMALSGDGRTYASALGIDEIQLIDRVGGLRETILTANARSYRPVSLSSDGRYTAFAPYNGETTPPQQVYVYDRDSGDGDGMASAWETAFGLNPTNLTDAAADADLDGVTNLQEYVRGTHPAAVPSATRYFAEGAANAFFTTRLAAVNPGDDTAAVVFRFLGSNGATSSVMRTIAPRSRITVDLPANGPTPGNDFSTIIESNHTVVVDRTMTWDSTGYGAHAETAILAPSTTWHLAEGATHGAFDLFYLLQNPNGARANVTIDYLRQAPLAPVSKTYAVEPNTRMTIPVDGEGSELEAVDVAAAITSDLPIVVERAMYSTRPGQPAFAAGHGAAGVTAPALRWFLAEGATGTFFDLYVLVGNPNTTASNLKVTYLLPSGAPFEKTYSVGPRQRLTIYVQDEDARLANTPVSVIVESTNNQPVVVERAMWWPKDQWHEAHVSAGATTTGTRWALADGEVSSDAFATETYILIANTSTTAGTATVTLLEEGGTPTQVIVDLQASSRVNVPVSGLLPPSAGGRRRFGALVESNGVEIVVERAMYSNAGGITWGAGTAALGTKLQ
jgi:Tol biopolymer transport system component